MGRPVVVSVMAMQQQRPVLALCGCLTYKKHHYGGHNRGANSVARETGSTQRQWLAGVMVPSPFGGCLRHSGALRAVVGRVDTRNTAASFAASYFLGQF